MGVTNGRVTRDEAKIGMIVDFTNIIMGAAEKLLAHGDGIYGVLFQNTQPPWRLSRPWR